VIRVWRRDQPRPGFRRESGERSFFFIYELPPRQGRYRSSHLSFFPSISVSTKTSKKEAATWPMIFHIIKVMSVIASNYHGFFPRVLTAESREKDIQDCVRRWVSSELFKYWIAIIDMISWVSYHHLPVESYHVSKRELLNKNVRKMRALKSHYHYNRLCQWSGLKFNRRFFDTRDCSDKIILNFWKILKQTLKIILAHKIEKYLF